MRFLKFLKENPTYFWPPRRGISPGCAFRNHRTVRRKLYIQTGHVKPVYQQMIANPKIEICAFCPSSGTWLRVDRHSCAGWTAGRPGPRFSRNILLFRTDILRTMETAKFFI